MAKEPTDLSTSPEDLDGSADDKPLTPTDELLPHDIIVPPMATQRPMVLDLHRTLKRHRLIFGFYSRLIFTLPDGTEVPCQRYFHYNGSPARQGAESLDADQLFVCQHNIDDHLLRIQEIARNHSPCYFGCGWQATQVLEASAREVERLHAAILTNRADYWPQRTAVAKAARLARPEFLPGGDWTYADKIPLEYPTDVAQQITYLQEIALTEGEDRGVFMEMQDVERVALRQALVPRADHQPQPSPNPATHLAKQIQPSSDYRSVLWGSKIFRFTSLQAEVVKLLHAEYERGSGLGLAEATIVETLRSNAMRPRVSHMFRIKNKQHEAWMTMIVRSSKGTFCLAEPNHQ